MDKFTLAYIECALWSTTGSPFDTCPECGEENKLLPYWRESDQEHVCITCHENPAIETKESNYEPSLDEFYGRIDISEKTLAQMISDCEAFQRDNQKLLERWYEFGESEDRAGHDFWLTREGHGAGFWDRWSNGGIEEKTGDELSDKAKEYGCFNLQPGDDGKLHH